MEPINMVHECEVIGQNMALPDGRLLYMIDMRLVTSTSPDPADERQSILRLNLAQTQVLIGLLSQVVAQHLQPPTTTPQ